MPSSLRVRLPLTVSVRGQPGEGQLDGLASRIADVARRALLQARREALRSGLDLAADPSCVLSLDPSIPNAGSGEITGRPPPGVLETAVEDAARRGIGLAVARFDSGLDTLLPLATPHQADGGGLTSRREDRAEDPPQIAVFENQEMLRAYAEMSFPEQSLLPRGHLRTGVYGFWAADMLPYVFWVAGQVSEGVARGELLWHATGLVHGRRHGDQFVAEGAGNVPAAVEPGGFYRLTVAAGAPAPTRAGHRRRDRPAVAELRREGAGRGRAVYLAAADVQALRGLQVRFAVTFTEVIAFTTAPEATPALPTAEDLQRRQGIWHLLWGSDALPAEPQGEPDWLWQLFGWLDVQPAEMRANRLLRQVLTDWEGRGLREQVRATSVLVIAVWRQRLYQDFCQLVAIDMLDISQARMLEFKKAMEDQVWKERFAARVHGLAGMATVLDRIRHLAAIREDLDAMRRRFAVEQQSGPPEYGVAVRQEEIDAAVREVAQAEADAPREDELAFLLELAAEQEPLLALLTIRADLTIALEQAIAEAPVDPETLAAVVREGLDFLIGKTREARADLSRPDSDGYKLQIVQQEANRQLEPWLKADRALKADIERLLSRGLVEWLALGGVLLTLTLLFPPLGIALSAVVSGYSAYTSIGQAVRLERLSRVRLAQYGFRALVSEEELAAAVQQAVLDVLFAAIDVGAAAGAATKGLRMIARGASATRATAGALRLSLEPLAARLRSLTEWPAELRDAVRAGLLGELERQGVADGTRLADELLGPVQRELAARYEAHLGEIADRFGRDLEASAELASDPEAIRRWLAAERLSPDEFVNRLLSEELIAGRELFDRTVARRLAGQPPLVEELVRLPSPEELRAVELQLGELSTTLHPARVLALRQAAGLRGLTYAELAERLRLILSRVDAPEAALVRLEWLLPGRPDAASVLSALGELPNPQAALQSLTPELLDAAGRGVGTADLVRAISEAPGAGETVERVAVVAEGHEAGQLVRGVRRGDGTRYVQRWQQPTASWETAPRRLLPAGEPVPGPGEPPRAGGLELEFEELPVEEPPPLDQPPAGPQPTAGAAAQPPRTFRNALDSVQITPEEIASYRQAYRRYVRERGSGRALRTQEDYARWRHGIATRQFSPAEIRAAVERSWERFNAAIERVPLESIPSADLARLRSQYQQNLASAWRGEPYRMLSQDEWVRWRYGVEQNRILTIEGPPKPLGELIGQLAGHELEHVVNGRLPAGAANSRNFKIFGVEDGFRPDHLPPGAQTSYLDNAGRIHATPGPGRTPFSARFVGDSKYLETAVPFDAQTEAFVRLAAGTDEKAVVFYVRWRDGFPPPTELTAGPFGVGYELPATARSGLVSGNLVDFAAGRRPPIAVRIVSDPNWR
jgi:hypothetical protein